MNQANWPELTLSRRVESIPQALSIYINQQVYDLKRRGFDVTTLSLGEAFFDIPLFDFRKLDAQKCYHYSDSQGIPELRAKIAQYYQQRYAAPVDGGSELLITAGSKPAIFMAMETVLDPGEEVLIHEPAWLSYQEQARLAGAEPRFIPFDCPVDEFQRYFTPRTRMVIINNPNNPAGRLYTRAELESLWRQGRAHGAYILIDEAYSDFVLHEPFVSMAAVVPDKQGIIVVNSLSKNLGMSGWRVGYVIGAPRFIAGLLKLNQHLITCAPSILLYYLARYLDRILTVTLPQVQEVVRKRERIAARLEQLGLSALPGGCTFYFFVSIGDFPGTSLDLALHMLLRHRIAVVPGSAYGESTERFIRVSIGTESEERIDTALQILRDTLRLPSFDSQALHEEMAAMKIPQFTVERR